MGKPTNNEILSAVNEWGNHNATYVVRNVLNRSYAVSTAWVLRQLKRLERSGLVERKPTCYSVMIVWGCTDAGKEAIRKTLRTAGGERE